MIRWLAIMALGVGASACDNSDVGDLCNMDVPVDSGGTSEGDLQRAYGSEIVEYNAEFECTSTVCVASLGHDAYCSAECKNDDHCPQAFECRELDIDLDLENLPAEVVTMVTQKYCVWRTCNVVDDCGGEFDYVCSKVEELSLGGDVVRQCARAP